MFLNNRVEADAQSRDALSLRQYDMEFDIRDLKVTMDTENIRAKRLVTVLKELPGSAIAYHVVAQFRTQAAKLGQVAPRRLSFTGGVAFVCLSPAARTGSEFRGLAEDIHNRARNRVKTSSPQPTAASQLSASCPPRRKTRKGQMALRKNEPQISDDGL